MASTAKQRSSMGAWGSSFRPKAPAAPSAPAAPKPVQMTPEQIGQLGNAYAALHPGWTPPAGTVPAGVNLHPGSGGTPTPPVPPFMTGPDITAYGDAFKSQGDQIATADAQLGDIKAQAQTALYNIGRNYLQGTDNTQNDAAARGIFQSSIKDGSLADLAATKATMTSDVNTRVNNAQLFHDGAINRINNWWTNFQNGMNATKVANAADAGAGAPPYVAGQEPTSSTFSVPKPAAAGAPAPGTPNSRFSDAARSHVNSWGSTFRP